MHKSRFFFLFANKIGKKERVLRVVTVGWDILGKRKRNYKLEILMWIFSKSDLI